MIMRTYRLPRDAASLRPQCKVHLIYIRNEKMLLNLQLHAFGVDLSWGRCRSHP